MKKSKFFTLICALMPGAGQMYQGQMKKGLSLMSIFFGIIAIASLLSLEEILFVLPIVWFYSFFDCINKWSLTVEELSYIEDKMLFNFKVSDDETIKRLMTKQNIFVGGVFFFIGSSLLYKTLIREYMWKLDNYIPGIGQFADKLPTLMISIIIILIGLKLIVAKRGESRDMDTL